MELLKRLSVGFAAELDGKQVTDADFALTGTEKEKTGVYQGVSAQWKAEEVPGGITVRLTLSGVAPHRCKSLCPVTLFYPEGLGKRMYVSHGWDCRFCTIKPGDSFMNQNAYLSDENGRGLMVRSVMPLKFREFAETKVDETGAHLCIRQLIPGSYTQDTIVSPAVFIAEGDLNEALKAYEDMIPEISRHTPPVVGYNTWDYYFSDISLEKVEENLAVIDKTPCLKEHLKYFTIDDGWQTAWGEWVPNYRFPGGMEAFSETVRAHGLLPGVWTAPLNVSTTSAPAIRSLRGASLNEHGDPARIDGMYYLDPTHPEARKTLKALFSGLYKAGIRLFKVDYVSRVLDMQYFYDPAAGPYDALRLLFADIRESVGEDSIINGCSLPAEALSPDADCGRTGWDMHNVWGHVTWSIESYQYRWREQPKIWANDIDFLLVRGPETDFDDQPRNPLDPVKHIPMPDHGRWRGGDDFSLVEAQTWAAVVMLTGGNMILSDRLAVLNDKGMTIIRKALENRSTVPAEPLDQFAHDYPALWKQENKTYVINWNDEETTLTVPVEGPVKELWSEKELIPENGTLTLNLPAHGSAVLIEA